MGTGDDILRALQGTQVSASENPYGIGATVLGGALPSLINPYGSSGSNLGIAVGGGLLSALLGGFARSEANSTNAATNKAIAQFSNATPEEQEALVAANPNLEPLRQQTVLTDLTNRMDIAKKVNEAKALAPIELEKQEALKALELSSIGPKKRAEIEAENAAWGGDLSANPASPQAKVAKQNFDERSALRDKFQALPAFKDYETVEKGFKAMLRAIDDPSGTSDIDLGKGAIQAIEPGLSVNGGEFNAVANTASIPEKWKAGILSAFKGESKLSPEVREGLIAIAKRRYEGHAETYNKALDLYDGEAQERGLSSPGKSISYLGRATSSDEITQKYRPNAPKSGGALTDTLGGVTADERAIIEQIKAKKKAAIAPEALTKWGG